MNIESYIDQINIADKLDKEILATIGSEVTRGYDLDKSSRSDWEKATKIAMDLAMQVSQEKTWPWPKAANVKYPLITTAAIQFSARAYPAIVSGADVVKGEVTGPDDDGEKKLRAERIGQHMSYQLLNQVDDWDEETDKLLLQIAIVGCAFRKTYFDSALGKNCSDLVSAKNLVFNHMTPWRKLRRVTHELFPFKNEVIEKVRSGLWEYIELGPPPTSGDDEDGHYEFLEQHCWYDLDDDGYKEPYIVTVKKDTSEVVRIVARFDRDGIYLNGKQEISKIVPVEYFTKFSFMPNPDGGSYDIGLGLLLNPINETVNTTLNQLLDAATLSIAGGGFIGSGLRMKGGVMRFAPGEYRPIDSSGSKIADNIYHMQHPGPSQALFQLLGMLIEAGKDISSVKDILTGEQKGDQTATTTLALIEQGQKVFSAIYKRVHRSLKQEFRKLYRLNKLYMQPEEYFIFQDKALPILLEDYQGDDTDVSPVSDPSLVSDTQRLATAEAMMKFVGDPHINQTELRRLYLTALKQPNPDRLLVEGQDPEKEQMQQQMQQMDQAIQQLTQETDGLKMAAQGAKIRAEIEKDSMELSGAQQMFEMEKKAAFDSLAMEKDAVLAKIEQENESIAAEQQRIQDKAINDIKRMVEIFSMKLEHHVMSMEGKPDDEADNHTSELVAMHSEMAAMMREAIAAITGRQEVIAEPDYPDYGEQETI